MTRLENLSLRGLPDVFDYTSNDEPTIGFSLRSCTATLRNLTIILHPKSRPISWYEWNVHPPLKESHFTLFFPPPRAGQNTNEADLSYGFNLNTLVLRNSIMPDEGLPRAFNHKTVKSFIFEGTFQSGAWKRLKTSADLTHLARIRLEALNSEFIDFLSSQRNLCHLEFDLSAHTCYPPEYPTPFNSRTYIFFDAMSQLTQLSCLNFPNRLSHQLMCMIKPLSEATPFLRGFQWTFNYKKIVSKHPSLSVIIGRHWLTK